VQPPLLRAPKLRDKEGTDRPTRHDAARGAVVEHHTTSHHITMPRAPKRTRHAVHCSRATATRLPVTPRAFESTAWHLASSPRSSPLRWWRRQSWCVGGRTRALAELARWCHAAVAADKRLGALHHFQPLIEATRERRVGFAATQAQAQAEQTALKRLGRPEEQAGTPQWRACLTLSCANRPSQLRAAAPNTLGRAQRESRAHLPSEPQL
jgi:hypothetical protein